MNAPDPNSKPDPTPEALAAGQRALAAIVFTDTVEFSKLMSVNEELTLRLVGRDLQQMRVTCEAFGGQVLKSTGDGLLMLFTSAVQAVACGLEIQRDFQKLNLERPKTEQLRHRIGLHLGDVFQHGGDVMGDGVNIAARLQTQAVPGGICVSQTVYDVVNNRLPFYVNDLGARTLKNIGKVTAYQISPSDGDRSSFRIAWYRWRSRLASLAGWCVLPLLVIVFYLGMHRQWAMQHRGQPGAFTLLPLPPQKPEQAEALPKPEPVAPVASPETEKVPPGEITEVSAEEFEVARFERIRNYDFEGMMDWVALHDWPGKRTSNLVQRCHDMEHLFRWTQERLHGHSETNPLVVTDAEGKKTAFWTVSFGGLKMKTGSQTFTVLREQIPPAMIEQIVRELLKEQSLPADERAHFEKDLTVFTDTYHLQPEVKSTAP
jgi:class 3 adenylate cyclase